MSTEERPRILWIHPGGLIPVSGGGAARTWALIEFLQAQGYAVELVTGDQGTHHDALAQRVDRLWIEAREATTPENLSWKQQLRNGLKQVYLRIDPDRKFFAILSRRAPQLAPTQETLLRRNRRPRLENFAGRIAYERRPVAAIASYAWLARTLDHMPPGTLRILDTIDIQHERRENAAAAGGNLDHVVCSREEEIRELNRADVLLAIQAEEGRALAGMCPEKTVIVAEHAHAVPDYVASPEGGRDVLYVGNRYDPNVLGLQRILRAVWPEVQRQCPDASLTICGRVGETVQGHPSGVCIAGQVPDLAPYYREAAVVLNPVPYGTGLKIKTVEGLAHGRCVVCTEAGTGGLGNPTELPLLVTDEAADMATRLVRLLQNPAERYALEYRAWEFAATRFAPERVYAALLAKLAKHRGLAP